MPTDGAERLSAPLRRWLFQVVWAADDTTVGAAVGVGRSEAEGWVSALEGWAAGRGIEVGGDADLWYGILRGVESAEN